MDASKNDGTPGQQFGAALTGGRYAYELVGDAVTIRRATIRSCDLSTDGWCWTGEWLLVCTAHWNGFALVDVKAAPGYWSLGSGEVADEIIAAAEDAIAWHTEQTFVLPCDVEPTAKVRTLSDAEISSTWHAALGARS
jgi:hypothetical protein